ncbi:Rv1733c family protein [Streptomyces sp. HG99]|uniref:Rv1733c family protein n=1 Tax=Streptomyces sp. HG99 TaxID=1958787 RepID=UPI002695FA9C
MRKARRTKILGWRWRRNPLRRHSDVVEASIVLATWATAVVGGAAAGVVAARAVDGTVRHDRAERRPVSAVMVRSAPSGMRDLATGLEYDQVAAKVRWTDGSGTLRTGESSVKSGTAAGAVVTVWTDSHGRLVSGRSVRRKLGTRRADLRGCRARGRAGR